MSNNVIRYAKFPNKYLNLHYNNYRDVNNNIMELLIMAYACKTSSARSIVGVIPYLPYSKQCKMRKRGCIVSKLLAKVSKFAKLMVFFYI